jgi:6-hydroxymethylpterin diphosphokinase MptE-like
MRDHLETWARGLTELISHGEALERAALAGDVIAAIAASQEARGARARLAGVTPPTPTTPDELRALGEVSALGVRARHAEVLFDRWRTRPVPPDEQLAATPLGAAVLADTLLPAAWDAEADVVVLVGDGWKQVAEIALAMGQRRIVVLAGDAPEGAIAAADLDEVVRAIRIMDPCPPRRFAVRGLGALARARMGEVADAVGSVLADHRVHRNTIGAFSSTWIAQGAANLPHVARWPSIGAIGDRFAGVPMIIAVPGPSLARNVEQLRAARGKAIIAAVSHSLRPLLAAGVTPDLVFAVDPQDVRYHFGDADVGAMTLVTGVTVHPALYELGAARYLTVAANSALDEWMYEGLGESPQAAGGGSVATTAFSAALRWKCDPIVFVGLDLSFPDGRYYVDTSCDGGARAVNRDGKITVEGWSNHFHDMKRAGGPRASSERAVELAGWHGGTVPSSFMFSMFHRWFVETLRRQGATAGRVCNCTEGGAFIDGMEHVPLASVLAGVSAGPALDVAAILGEVVASLDAPARARVTRDRTAALVRDLRRCASLAGRCRKLAAVAAHDPDAERKLSALEAELSAALGTLGFVSMLAQRDIEEALGLARQVGDTGEALAASRVLFEVVGKAAAEVAPHLEAAVRAFDAELGEEAANGG